MADLILVTGGARSGKSDYAQGMAEGLPGKHLYIATCPPADPGADPEMARRIDRHLSARRGRGWDSIEEGLDIAGIIQQNHCYQTILIDCLTLWVSNQLLDADVNDLDEDIISHRCQRLIDACRAFTGTVIMVTNEVGLGVVPENALARKFRDLSGRCNQIMASAAAEVYMLISSIPMQIKG